ncbi:MAG: hypothetical protein AB1512_10460 [Thermodesulfobacteriota bacterium]
MAWRRIFVETSFPAVLGLILGCIGWIIVQLDTLVFKAPIVETSLTCISTGNRTYVRASLVNTSPDKTFPELEAILQITDPDPRIKYLHHSHALTVPSPSRIQSSPLLCDKDFKFTIAEFQPYTKIFASALIVGMTEPKLLIYAPGQAIKIKNKGVLTLIAKNRSEILLALLSLYLLFAGIYVYKLSKRYIPPSGVT